MRAGGRGDYSRPQRDTWFFRKILSLLELRTETKEKERGAWCPWLGALALQTGAHDTLDPQNSTLARGRSWRAGAKWEAGCGE